MPRVTGRSQGDPINFGTLFEFATLPEANIPKKRRKRRKLRLFSLLVSVLLFPLRKFSGGIEKLSVYLDGKIAKSIEKHRERAMRRRRLPSVFPLLWGGFFGTLTVCIITAAIVFLSLFSGFIGSYSELAVPDFLGREYDPEAKNTVSDRINLIVSYEYREDTQPGVVISQTPPPGSLRRIYGRNDYLDIKLTVSLGEKTEIMDNLEGKILRDALLSVKNKGGSAVVTEEYSEDVPKGSVISTEPAAGESFFPAVPVRITVSLGPVVQISTVPNLYGLTEIQAITLLLSQGLLAGEVRYAASGEPAGKVIAQGVPAYSSVESGSRISFTVSAGYSYKEKTVPNLYGLALADAKRVLLERGIQLGEIFAVPSSEPQGTVVAQSPAGGETATSTTTVDLYVSG